MVVVAVVATVATAGALAGPAAIAANGGILGAGAAALGGSVTGFGFGAAALAGAVGSVAGQVTGMALGVQDKFSWSAVATGAIGAGIGATSALASIVGQDNIVGQAMAGNLINQGEASSPANRKALAGAALR